MRPRYSRFGSLAVFWWAGSWTFPPRSFPCPVCRNFYIGPFGFELDRPDAPEPVPDTEEQTRWPGDL